MTIYGLFEGDSGMYQCSVSNGTSSLSTLVVDYRSLSVYTLIAMKTVPSEINSSTLNIS